MWLVKNSTWIRKYESQVIKSNPDTLFIFNFCHELIGKQNFSGIFFEAISLLPLKLISSWSYSHPLSYFLKIDLTLTYQKIVDICYSYLKIMYSILTFTSILIILHIIIIPRKKHNTLSCYALLWSLLLLAGFCLFYLSSKDLEQFQYIQPYHWLQQLGICPHWGGIILVLGSLSLLSIGLSLLLVPLCVLISWNAIESFKKKIYHYFFISLLLIHVFVVMDFLYYLKQFSFLFLIIVWGSREEKVKAPYYFFSYTLIGSFLMLLTIFKIYALTGTT